MHTKSTMVKFAHLTVNMGARVLPGSTLVIRAPLETSDFVRELAREAYHAGAKDVVVHYSDDLLTHIRLEHASVETLSHVPDWQAESINSYAQDGACFIKIYASDPDVFSDIDPKKLTASLSALQAALRPSTKLLMSNQCRWCVVSVPVRSWATKVFPGVSEDEAYEKLWDIILKVSRVDEKTDPVDNWTKHNAVIAEKKAYMNSLRIKKLHYKSARGTDLTIELPKGHIWLGGAEKDATGVLFNANIPTEEVYSMPHKTGVNGTVIATKPLSYNGNLIDKFRLTFKDGRIVDFAAEKGYDALKKLIETDEGSHYIGEVALVPDDSPISNSGVLFYQTLFDENASCHLAIGASYSTCLEGTAGKTEEELLARGANQSMTHVDFMVGSPDMNITATLEDGSTKPIFVNGNWA